MRDNTACTSMQGLARRFLVLATMVLGTAGAAPGAVTVLSDSFAADASGNRDNGDPLNGVAVELRPGAEVWDANSPNTLAFVQPAGTVTNTTDSQIRGSVPIDGTAFPIGSEYKVRIDVKFQAGSGDAARFVQVGLGETLNLGAAGAHSVLARLYADGTWEIRWDGTNILADQTHANAQAFVMNPLTGWQTVEVVYNQKLNSVRLSVNGTQALVPRLVLGQWMPTISRAGFSCAAVDVNSLVLPANAVQFDNFQVSADDSTAITIIDGPATFAGNTYYLLSPSAWAPAQAKAIGLGGNLVAVDGKPEQDWLFTRWGNFDISGLGIPPWGTAGENCLQADFGSDGKIDGLYIGYHRPGNPAGPYADWAWVSGANSSYANWDAGKPTGSANCPTAGATADIATITGAVFGKNGAWWDFNSGSSAAAGAVVEVRGVEVNGFRTNHLYTKQTNAVLQVPPKPPGNNLVNVYDDATGALVDTFSSADTGYRSITFSDEASAQHTALYAVKLHPSDISNLKIDRIDAGGHITATTTLKAIYAAAGATYPADHVNVNSWSMRYSRFHDGLVIAVNPDRSATGGTRNATIHLVSTNLTGSPAVLGGPWVIGVVDGSIGDDGDVIGADVNNHNGDVYAAASTLSETATPSTRGKLLKLVTAGAGAGTVSVLIDGVLETSPSGWATSGLMRYVFYRGVNNPEGVETIAILHGQAGMLGEEYYLHQTASSGNLLKRADTYAPANSSGPGQLDDYSGTILSVRQARSPIGGQGNGVDQYLTDDVLFRPSGSQANDLLDMGHFDVDSPGFAAMNVTPMSTIQVVAFVGQTPPPAAFLVLNKGYSGTVSYTVAESPEVTWLALGAASGGPIAAPGNSAVTVNLNTTGLSTGIFSTDLVFTDTGSGEVLVRRVEMEVKECNWEVKPETTQSAKINADMTVYGGGTHTATYPITLTNLGGSDIEYTVEEVDGADPATANPTDYVWLELIKQSSVVPSGGSVEVGAKITSDDTDKTAYVRFTPACTGASAVVRRIDVTRLVTSDGGEKAFKHVYVGDVNPLDQSSCGLGCTFEVHSAVNSWNQPVGAVENDGESQNGTAFHIVQPTGDPLQTTTRAGYQSHTTVRGDLSDVRDFISAKLGATMVARVKVLGNTNASGMIWAWSKARSSSTDPVRDYPKAGYNVGWGGVGPSHPDQLREFQITDIPIGDRTTGPLTSGIGQADYHIIRIVNGFGRYGVRTLKFYFDENPAPVLELPNEAYPELSGTQNDGTHDSFCFGTFGGGAAADLWLDWVSFTNMGMYAPGEEDNVIGSLLPGACCLPDGSCKFTIDTTCAEMGGTFQGPGVSCAAGVCKPDPFADTDRDGDVDAADFAIFQLCFTGEGGVATDDCLILDVNPICGDGDVDVFDLAEFEKCASGPGVPADPSCDDSLECP